MTIWCRICCCLSLSVFLFFTACSGDDSKRSSTQAAPVKVQAVRCSDVPRLLHAVGNVRASATVGVKPRVTGEILEVHFQEGQDVREGEPLVTIDPRPFEAILREKQGLLAKSEAQLSKASDDMRRYRKLVGGGYVSREAFEQTVTEAAALRATVQSDKAAVESAALDLAYCTVTAPIGGRVGALNVDKGNMVKNSDDTPIVTIDTLEPIYVNFSVPEANLPAILERMGQGEVPVRVTPTGGSPEEGRLTLVDNTVDVSTGTIRLRATFANEMRRLWPGLFVNVELPLGVARNALSVPSRAVLTGRDETYLYVVGKDGRAEYRKIRVLFEYEGNSVIEGEVQEGERVVEEGQVRLAPGTVLDIRD